MTSATDCNIKSESLIIFIANPNIKGARKSKLNIPYQVQAITEKSLCSYLISMIHEACTRLRTAVAYWRLKVYKLTGIRDILKLHGYVHNTCQVLV